MQPRRHAEAAWMLAASLPALQRGKAVPIGAERLRARLQLMPGAARAALHDSGAVLDALDAGALAEDGAALRLAARVLQRLGAELGAASAATFQTLLAEHTLLAALRLQRAGAPAPAPGWGVAGAAAAAPTLPHWPLVWAQPGLGLRHRHPWLAEAERRLDANDPLALQRLVDDRTWAAARRQREAEPFTLGAVWAWWLQWRLVLQVQARAEPGAALAAWRAALEGSAPSAPARAGHAAPAGAAP